jgi:hypothetical protein
MKKKKKKRLPKLFVEAIGNCCCSFSSTISLGKIILDTLKVGNWNLSPNRLNRNHTVSCNIQKMKLAPLILMRMQQHE